MPVLQKTWTATSQTTIIANPPGALSQNQLLDLYPNAAFAYSLRRLRRDYAGSAARIRRSSDNAEQDIGFDGVGNFDVGAATSFIGGGSGFIVTWYDQSTNVINATQPLAGNQLPYSGTGLGSKPTLDFGTGGFWLQTASISLSSYLSTQFSSFAVVNITASSDQYLVDWNNGSTDRFLIQPRNDSGTSVFQFGDDVVDPSGGTNSFTTPGGYTGVNGILEFFRDSSNTQAIVFNGSTLDTGTRVTDITPGSQPLAIGAQADTGFFIYAGKLSELIIWGTDLGAYNRTAVRNNINSYYTVF